jgi:outer membrane protein assembly factor BamB
MTGGINAPSAGIPMLITVVCPRCEGRLQVDEGLRGKRMRCPLGCGAVFEVQPEGEKLAEPAPRPPEAPRPETPGKVVTGSVADLIPVLPAELARPEPPPRAEKPPRPPRPAPPPAVVPAPVQEKVPPAAPPPDKPPVWQELPPPVRSEPAPAPAGVLVEAPADFPTDDFPTDDSPDAQPPPEGGPVEVGPGTWEAPPVRVEAAAPDAEGTTTPAAPLPFPDLAPPRHGARRRSLLVIAAMAGVLAGLIGFGWWSVERARAGSEEDRFRKAMELYDQGAFAEARDKLMLLKHDFPDSRDVKRYEFLAELSDVRDGADKAEPQDLAPALDRVLQFLTFNRNEPLLKDRNPDVWQTLKGLSTRLADQAGKQHDANALKRARDALAEAEKFTPPPGVNAPEVKQKLNEQFTQVAKELDVFGRRQQLLADIRQVIEQPSAMGVKASRARASQQGLRDDPEVAGLLTELVKAHQAAVVYTQDSGGADPAPAAEDDPPGLLVAPALVKPTGPARPAGVTVGLARGVLYALDPVRGELRWATRVGHDTTVLPLRVPPDPITPELVLTLTADGRSLSALVAETGAAVWRRDLGAPCAGAPLLVGRSLLVPTRSGRVEEVEITGGRLLGHYDLGQLLTSGGARQEGTPLVYFPGDEFCVYVLDVAKRACAAVLYSGHPAGSLRGPPILLPAPKATDGEATAKGPAGWMFLCQATGAGGDRGVEVRPFELPIRDPDQRPTDPTVTLRGGAAAAPWHDAEKLGLATDAGLLGLWGIRQKGNRDPLLFPLLAEPFRLPGGPGPGRAQLIHADAENYWVLCGGRLHRLESVFRPTSGPDLWSAWAKPLDVGSPLHAAEPHRAPSGRVTLLLTTLAPDRPSCLFTAVDADKGEVRWQRQLGCVPLHPPIAVGPHVLLRDATGLLLLDPGRFPDPPAAPWQPAGDLLTHEPIGDGEHVALLAGPDEFVELSWSGAGAGPAKLRARRVLPSGASTVKTFNLPAAPAGTPALGDGFVVLPLANGVALRIEVRGAAAVGEVSLGPAVLAVRAALGGGTVSAGPNWRAPGADDQAPGHVVALGGSDFLLTDGSRGLSRVSWAGPKDFAKRAGNDKAFARRIVAPPAVLPAKGGAPRVCVADASDTVTLLDAERLQVVRRWALPGKLTAGPLVRGSGVLCVVDRKRLVWIDPDREEPWEYGLPSDVAGEPQLVDGALVVADVESRFLALDPETGSPLGPGYTLRANTAPVSAPVPFGPGRLLVPLDDGTLLLLPMQKLR